MSNAIKTLMGWNQIVQVLNPINGSPLTAGILRVNSYNMGSKQEGEAPDYVTGATDRTAYTKGPVTTEGTLDFPITIESGSGTVPGFSFFKAGAELVSNPQASFEIQGTTLGEMLGGCKINSTTIKCDAKEHVSCSSTVWGVSEGTDNTSSSGNTIPLEQVYGDSNGAQGTSVVGQFQLVQIPMWDAVLVTGAPDGMYVIGFSVTIDNALQRNYTLGSGVSRSPYGLNATSISSKQRKITGTVKWQSDTDGSLRAIMGSGIKSLTVAISSVGTMTLSNCLWNAAPPTISTGDRMVCESPFTALGSTGGFDALTIA